MKDEDLEKNFKKLYYKNESSTEKVFPYYVRFENEIQAKTAISLLKKLALKR